MKLVEELCQRRCSVSLFDKGGMTPLHLASSLGHLDLSSNLLNRVPGAISGLALLRSLDLSHNSITHIDSGIFQNMTRLES